MKFIPMFFFFFAFAATPSAQTNGQSVLAQLDSIQQPMPSPQADRFMPSLADTDLLDFLYDRLRYPEIAGENGAEGTVVIALSVSKTGQIVKRQIVRSVPLLDQAALDATNALPRLLPAVENGQPIDKTLYIPILFRLR